MVSASPIASLLAAPGPYLPVPERPYHPSSPGAFPAAGVRGNRRDRSGHADDHPMPQHTPGPFRKLDAIAVLMGPLLPAPHPPLTLARPWPALPIHPAAGQGRPGRTIAPYPAPPPRRGTRIRPAAASRNGI